MSAAAVATTSVEAAAITTTSTVTTAGITTAATIASATVAIATATIAVASTVVAVASAIIASIAKADPYSSVSVRITIGRAIVTVGIAIGVIRVRCGSVGAWGRIGLRLFGLGSARVVRGLGVGIASIGKLAVVAIVLAVRLGRVVVGVRPLNGS